MYTQEEFDAHKARVAATEAGLNAVIAAVEAAVNGVITKQEDDVTNNAGAMTTGYDAYVLDLASESSDAAVQYTVTNLRAYGLKFKDLTGKEYFLGRAGGSNESVDVYGKSADILALVANSDVTAVAV